MPDSTPPDSTSPDSTLLGSTPPDSTFDADLLRRYDAAGPRYTSYPTAPQFTTDFGAEHFAEHARFSNAKLYPRPLSLYMHVPYCFSPCFYCGCNRVITRDVTKGPAYAARMALEIEMAGKFFSRDREVVQIHMGGGTPNFLSPVEIGALLSSAQRHFRLSASANRDFSMEIDPRFIREGDIAAYADLGFNRASLGVQDFDAAVQQAVNRVQTVEETRRVVDACRSAGFRSVNIDLIYGLPKQTLIGFAHTLDAVIALRPERLAIYGYAHLPTMFKAQRRIAATDLPAAEAKLSLLQLAIEKLSAAGYRYIGMDHFALPEDELARAQDSGALHRNFMGYTTHADTDLVAVGVSAISHVGNSYSQNSRDLPSWEMAIDAGRLPVWRGMTMTPDDVVRADVIQQLMCQGTVDVKSTARRHSIDFSAYFSTAIASLQPLAVDGLVVIDKDAISATANGRLLLRRIAMCFDRYLTQPPAPRQEKRDAVTPATMQHAALV